MKEYLITAAVTLVLKSIADLAVKYSKRTENTLDDVIATNFKNVVNFLNFKKK